MTGPHKWRQHLQGHVCRWTAPREAVLNLLSRTSKHMSAKNIYASLVRLYPGIGLTTVYRTLDLLHRSGIIHKIVFPDGQARFELQTEGRDGHHHHLICTGCGEITNYSEFEKEELELIHKTEDLLAKKFQFLIQDHNIEFFGLCHKCQPLKGGD